MQQRGCKRNREHAALGSAVLRQALDEGSWLVPSLRLRLSLFARADVAQLVEQRFRKAQVWSSSLHIGFPLRFESPSNTKGFHHFHVPRAASRWNVVEITHPPSRREQP